MISKKIVITGGGTGGHVFPGLAIAETFRARSWEVLYVGSSTGMEAKLVPERGFSLFTLRSGAVKNQGPLKIVASLAKVALSIATSIRFLRKHRPQAVIGVGGYVSVPVSIAAFLLRIPLYLQEQNVSVGIANRVLGRFARTIFLGFEQGRRYFPEKKCIVTGNPIRAELCDPRFPLPNPNQRNLLVVGGSQGARAINELIVGLLEVLAATFPGLSIVHQTGHRDFETVREAYRQKFSGAFEVLPFIQDMASAYHNASLVVCRSGALTVSELIQVQRPAIFIPYPRQGQNDQVDNARLVESLGAGRVVEQGARFKERFWSTLLEVFQPQILSQMAKNYSPLRHPVALASIADQIERDLAVVAMENV